MAVEKGYWVHFYDSAEDHSWREGPFTKEEAETRYRTCRGGGAPGHQRVDIVGPNGKSCSAKLVDAGGATMEVFK